MATFAPISVAEAKRMTIPPRIATQHQYREYVEEVRSNPEVAGRLDLDPDDRPITERARLKAAAKAEGVNLHIQRRGHTIVFWPTQEAPKRRGRPLAQLHQQPARRKAGRPKAS
jgi:hypothetical protein